MSQNNNLLPHTSLVSIELHRLLDLLFRASLKLPSDEVLVDSTYQEAISKVPNFELLCHLEPINEEYHKMLRELGYSSGEHIEIETLTRVVTCYRLSKADTWTKIREAEQARKMIQDSQRQEQLEWSVQAKVRLKKVVQALMSPPWSYEEREAIKHLNWLLTYDIPETLPMLKMFNILDLKEKILKVGDVMVYLN